MASVFTQIIEGKLPAYRVFETEKVISILALDQVTRGHTLVIPKVEVNHWYEVPEDSYFEVQRVAQVLGRALTRALNVPRVLTAAIGFEVPHYHLHLIPASSMADLNFSKAKRLSAEEMLSLQSLIVKNLER